jgi:FkbM family methyltransferase
MSEAASENVVAEREIGSRGDLLVPRRPAMRVAINAITEPAPKFGSRVYLWELATALAKTEGVDLILLVGEGQADAVPSQLRSHIREIQVPAGRSYLQLFRQKQIREALSREKVDFYHVPNTMPFLGRTIPTLVTIHAVDDLRVKKYGILRTGYRLVTNLLAAHLSDQILTVSENSKMDIVSLLRVPESKVTVIYNGVSKDFHPLDRDLCKKLLESKYSIQGNFLLAPGGLARNKNIPGILAAIQLLEQAGRRETLVLLGDIEAPEFKYVKGMIHELDLDRAVLLPGFVPREDLPAFYNASSLVLYPSLYEGFGLPVLEAMACGTPVITSNNSSLPEVAGSAALLVDPRNPREIADAVLRLESDAALHERLSAGGVLRAREFTWEKTAEKTLEAFHEIETKKRRLQYPAKGTLSAHPGKRWLSRIRKILSIRKILTGDSFTPLGRLDALKVLLALSGNRDESYSIRVPAGKVFIDGRNTLIDFRALLHVLLAEIYDELHVAHRIVIDIGAHKGYFAAYALMANAEAVWCFEPESTNFSYLSRFVESARNSGKEIQAFKSAIGDSDGDIILHKSHDSWGHTTLPNQKQSDGGRERVELRSLASILSEARKAFPSHKIVLKIDAEGAECAMLMNTPVASFASVKEIAFEHHSFSQCKLSGILQRFTLSGFQHSPSDKDPDVHFLFSCESAE